MLLDRLGKQNRVISFIFVRVYYLTTVEWKESLPGSSLSHLGHWSRNNDLSLFSGICIVAISISMVLLPCAASSTWTWVNQLLTLVQWLGWCRTTYHNFETLSHLGHLCVRFAMTSWRSTERLGDFSSESVVSHLVSWVSSWFVLVCFLGWVLVFGCVCFVWYWKTPGLLLSPILQHVGIANQRQYVLMTVWASSAHGMSSKKKPSLSTAVCLPGSQASYAVSGPL